MKKLIWASFLLTIAHATVGQNIGIGTSTPAVALHIKKNTNELLRLQGANPYISFFDNNNVAQGYLQGSGTDVLIGTHAGNSSGNIKFYNNNVMNMLIHNSGRVGIGTASPDYRLTVFEPSPQGNTNTHVLKVKGQNPVLAFADQSDNSYGYIKMWSYQPFAPFTNGLVIGASPGYPIFFSTNNFGVTMTVADNGTVGIGTTAPAAKLHVNKDAEALRLSGSGTYLSFYNGNTYKGYLWSKAPDDIELGTATDNTNGNLNLRVHGIDGLTVLNDGRVKVGSLACTLPVTINGSAAQLPRLSVHGALGIKKNWGDQIGEWTLFYGQQNYGPNSYSDVLAFFFNGGAKAFIDDADGSYYSYSDRRLKESFAIYKTVLPGIKKLDILTYHLLADKTGRRSFGLLAQNLQQYFPELVAGSEKEDGNYLAVAYAKTGVLAIKAIQEQQEIIDAQQKKIDMLEKRLEMLESRQR